MAAVLPIEAEALLAPVPGLRLAPVRHHSPRCAHHLRALMREFQPTHVLIEGPAELDALLPALQHARARVPLAAYLHARVPADAAGDEYWHCRCYVPFAAFSPEWVALREAARQGAAVRFIDLPYGARLQQQALRDYFARSPEPTLAQEPVRQAPDAVAALVQASGCRDFDEWWDRHFESAREDATASAYFSAVLGLSALLREQAGAVSDEDAGREAHMAAQVRAALDEGRRCLVVCGGMHVAGIVAGLRQAGSPGAAPPVQRTGVHLIPYTLARLERASGYAAGLPAPGYYQAVWQAMEAGTPRPDEAAWPAMAARLVSALRERHLPASLPDASEAVRLAHGLAALRGCHGGRMELTEALHSAVLRQDEDTGVPVLRLAGLLGDDTYGLLPPNAPLAPLLADVQDWCMRHGLPQRPALPVRKELDIYRSARHRRISQGLHRLCFLGVPYAQRLAGPDFVAGTGLARVREVWSLGWRVETAVALTEAMRYGASLQEAAIGRVRDKLADPAAEGGPAARVLEVLVMGLEGLADQVLEAVGGWVQRSHDALALAQATVQLARAFEACHALGGEDMPQLPPLLARCFQQACLRMPWLGAGDEAQQAAALDALADLHGMACRSAPWADAALLHGACDALYATRAPARVRGAAAGILAVTGCWDVAQAGAAIDQALGLAEHDAVSMGEFLQGFLRVSRGWLLSHPPMLLRLAQGVARWPEEAFFDGLPAMRLAFAQLSRAEIRQWGERLLARPAVAVPACPQAAAPAQALAEQVRALLQPWGLI